MLILFKCATYYTYPDTQTELYMNINTVLGWQVNRRKTDGLYKFTPPFGTILYH